MRHELHERLCYRQERLCLGLFCLRGVLPCALPHPEPCPVSSSRPGVGAKALAREAALAAEHAVSHTGTRPGARRLGRTVLVFRGAGTADISGGRRDPASEVATTTHTHSAAPHALGAPRRRGKPCIPHRSSQRPICAIPLKAQEVGMKCMAEVTSQDAHLSNITRRMPLEHHNRFAGYRVNSISLPS